MPVLLEDASPDVVLVAADDLNSMLGVVRDVASREPTVPVAAGDLDADKVDSFVTEHPSGARALLAPTRPDQAATVTISFLRKVFELLRGRYDFVIVDTPPAFSPEVITAVDTASHLCLVGM